MALLDNLSKKASAVGSMAIQKTKVLSEISKLNSQISEEENQKNYAFHKMGQLYYSLHASDCEDDFIPIVNTVIESEKRISDLRKQIDALKGIQRCEKCGAELEKGAAFCSSCGASTPKRSEILREGKVICGNCGAFVTKGSRFCTSCGKPVESVLLQQEETEQGKRLCSNCGSVVEEDSLFCTNCGQKYQKAVTLESEDKPVEPVLPPKEETEQPKRICQNCGFVVEEDSLFCTDCGQKYQEAATLESEDDPMEPVLPPNEETEPPKRICQNCGSDVEEDSLFCTNCGQKYQEAVTLESEDKPVESVLPSQDETEQEKWICPNCGAMVDEDFLFCTKCGRKLAE